MTTLADVTHAVFRIGIGLLFLQHGLQKVFGLLGGEAVPLMSQMGLAGALELVGGGLLILGLFTRPVAAVLTLEMLVAYAIAHVPRGWIPIQNGGEPALLFALAFIYFAGNGAGAFSVDAWLQRRHHRASRVDIIRRRAA